jgi:hypothetical protein
MRSDNGLLTSRWSNHLLSTCSLGSGTPTPLPHPSMESSTYARMKRFIRESKGLRGKIRETKEIFFKLMLLVIKYHINNRLSRKICSQHSAFSGKLWGSHAELRWDLFGGFAAGLRQQGRDLVGTLPRTTEVAGYSLPSPRDLKFPMRITRHSRAGLRTVRVPAWRGICEL